MVCSECSEHKATLQYDPIKPYRVCESCYKILNGREQQEMMDSEKRGVLEVFQ